MMMTIDYGYLEIRYNRAYIQVAGIDIIEDCEGNNYEVCQNMNGKLQLFEVQGLNNPITYQIDMNNKIEGGF